MPQFEIPAPTASRVPATTPDALNQCIARSAAYEAAYYERHPEQIPDRLRELDREWDIERAIQTEAPIMTTAGILLGLAVNRAFFFIPLFAQAMLMLHALQGWYPLLPILRRLGFRTPNEIERERATLRSLAQHPVDLGHRASETSLPPAPRAA